MPTYPLTFPTVGIVASTFKLVRAVSTSTSPFTFNQQVYRFGGERWEGSVTFRPMRRTDAGGIQAFLAELRGQYGTFLYGDPDALALGKLGAGGGTPLVKGASQTGNTLIIDGATAAVSNWLMKGDYFSLGTGTDTRLYMLVANVNTNSLGEATLTFEPALRASPADNAAVTITSPRGTFRLAESVAQWSSNYASIYDMSLSFVEAISE